MTQPILGEAKLARQAAEAWARKHGASPAFVGLARWYWLLAPERGVRPEVAYAQSSVETGWGNFGGVIDASYMNPAGIKVGSGPSGNFDPHAHMRFPSWACGVAAHLDHLSLYAGAPGYPRAWSPDPRHFAKLLGAGTTVEAVAPRYATDPSYSASWLARLASLLAA